MKKIKYFVTATGKDLLVIRFDFEKHEKQEAIACVKNLSLRFRDAEIFSVDSEDDEIVYNLTKNYI